MRLFLKSWQESTDCQENIQFMSFAMSLAQAFPEIRDAVDVDYTIEEYAGSVGAPRGMLRSREEIRAARQARAEAEQAQEQQQRSLAAGRQMQQLSGAARNLGETTVGADGQRCRVRALVCVLVRRCLRFGGDFGVSGVFFALLPAWFCAVRKNFA